MSQLTCADFVTLDEVLESACACDLNDGTYDDLITEYCADASDVLYILSGGRVFGRCTRTVWPYRTGVACGPGFSALFSGYGTGYGSGADRWSWIEWDSVDSIPLMGPQTEIVEITIDGDVIAPSEYGLVDGYKLFRRVGSWPSVNDITLANTEKGTFTIEYSFGPVPNMMTKRAAIELICSMTKADGQTLNRMKGIVSANVQGVAISMADDEIRSLGLPEVSKFMDVFGGRGQPQSGVFSPELSHGWRLLTVSDGVGV